MSSRQLSLKEIKFDESNYHMIAIFNDDSFITINQLDWPEMRSMHRIEITFYTKISLGHLNPFKITDYLSCLSKLLSIDGLDCESDCRNLAKYITTITSKSIRNIITKTQSNESKIYDTDFDYSLMDGLLIIYNHRTNEISDMSIEDSPSEKFVMNDIRCDLDRMANMPNHGLEVPKYLPSMNTSITFNLLCKCDSLISMCRFMNNINELISMDKL